MLKRPAAACCLLLGAFALAADQAKPDPKEAILRRFVEEFVPLKPGTDPHPASFKMGSEGDVPAAEKPAHAVTFKYAFAMAKYEVTQELFGTVMGQNPSKWKGPRNSVDKVTWAEANEFCRKATAELRLLKLIGGNEVIRLPTEAEWEYACRAGTTTRYSFGDDPAGLKDYAWFKENSKGEDPPVGKKKPNAWGLYDMHGYIWEWCQDAWHPSYEGAPADGSARDAKDAKERVLRGGAWPDPADMCRSAYRFKAAVDVKSDAIGFRCVRADEKK